MTQIVGNVLDVGLEGTHGTMTVWAGFRPEANALIAPVRKTYGIAGGVIPEGVSAVPGPAVIVLDLGVNAYKQLDVVIPDGAQVTIQALFLQSYVWEPYVLSEVGQSLQDAEAAALAAGQSATAADGSASAAAGSASSAADSASAAASAASAASGSASAAAGSASDAADSATSAGSSAGAAAGARDAAEGHALSAAGSASAAAGSASAAAGSASAAAGSAADADGHAGRAEAAANEFGLSVTSSTLAPGAAATVTVSGDGPAYSLAFGVPQGPKGDKGDEGEISQAQLDAAVASLVDNAPEALNTLSELSTALGDDPNFATTTATAIGERAKIDGAPAAYNTLGKLVAALQSNELGGSTDAAELTGALTDAVDASAAVIQYHPGGQSEAVATDLAGAVNDARHTGQAAYDFVMNQVLPGMEGALESKSDVGHTHPVSDLTTTGTASSTTYLRGDGSWATPTNTTYSVPTQAEAEAGTATTARAFSAQRVRQAADAAVSARVQLVASFPTSPVSGVLYLKAE